MSTAIVIIAVILLTAGVCGFMAISNRKFNKKMQTFIAELKAIQNELGEDV